MWRPRYGGFAAPGCPGSSFSAACGERTKRPIWTPCGRRAPFWAKEWRRWNLAGAEGLYPTRDYLPLFSRARQEGLPFTIHAGEAAGPDSVWAALEAGAARIGHGVRAAEDPALTAVLARRGIPLEMCPTSNFQTGAAAPGSYPLKAYLKIRGSPSP